MKNKLELLQIKQEEQTNIRQRYREELEKGINADQDTLDALHKEIGKNRRRGKDCLRSLNKWARRENEERERRRR